jgi:hypothetical protein
MWMVFLVTVTAHTPSECDWVGWGRFVGILGRLGCIRPILPDTRFTRHTWNWDIRFIWSDPLIKIDFKTRIAIGGPSTLGRAEWLMAKSTRSRLRNEFGVAGGPKVIAQVQVRFMAACAQ